MDDISKLIEYLEIVKEKTRIFELKSVIVDLKFNLDVLLYENSEFSGRMRDLYKAYLIDPYVKIEGMRDNDSFKNAVIFFEKVSIFKYEYPYLTEPIECLEEAFAFLIPYVEMTGGLSGSKDNYKSGFEEYMALNRNYVISNNILEAENAIDMINNRIDKRLYAELSNVDSKRDYDSEYREIKEEFDASIANSGEALIRVQNREYDEPYFIESLANEHNEKTFKKFADDIEITESMFILFAGFQFGEFVVTIESATEQELIRLSWDEIYSYTHTDGECRPDWWENDGGKYWPFYFKTDSDLIRSLTSRVNLKGKKCLHFAIVGCDGVVDVLASTMPKIEVTK